jgi:hypothetical protein
MSEEKFSDHRGENWQEVRRLDGLVKYKGAEKLIERTSITGDFGLIRKHWPRNPPEKVGELYRRSLPAEDPNRLAGGSLRETIPT